MAGDRVAIILPQRPETGIAHMACYQMGAIALPLSHLFGADALEYRLAARRVRVAIIDESGLEKLGAVRDKAAEAQARDRRRRRARVLGARVGQLLPLRLARYVCVDTAADDPALIIYTSGTTGNPKGALIAQRSLLGNLSGFVCSHDFYPQARRHVLVAGRLGVDRRPVRRAAAELGLRPADARLSRPLRSGEGLLADGEVRRAERLPLSHRAEDDDEGGAEPRSATTSSCAAS
jgi:acyl-CoA synthetase (AMP-forming)/AMP-acid ligase II